MQNRIKELVKGKRVLILGYGREGRATRELLIKAGGFISLGIADKAEIADAEGAVLHTGEGYLDCIDSYDIAFKSPGIVLPKAASKYKCMITSETEQFLAVYGRQTVGITGTKGKSTVSSLIFHILSAANIPAVLVGNIGIPVFSAADKISPETAVIFEMSCHQLEYCKYSPSFSILLNLYEDHLDHYGSVEKYHSAKKNIYLSQSKFDFAVFSKETLPPQEDRRGNCVVADKGRLPFGSLSEIGATLAGEHNFGNCAFAYEITRLFGVSDKVFTEAVRTFIPLRHRLEYLGENNGIDFYDDSISTTAESAISAVRSVKNAKTLLLGGMDRGIDYSGLIDFLEDAELDNILLMYDSGQRIGKLLAGRKPRAKVEYCTDLENAVKRAKQLTPIGGACVLSPASASYGYFKNFEERGTVFKSLCFDKAQV